MSSVKLFDQFDASAEIERIIKSMRQAAKYRLHKRGAVVGVSGGIDSSVVLALCVKAFGAERVLALMLPEKESSADNFPLTMSLLEQYNVAYLVEEISGALDGFSCYARRDEEIKKLFPEYDTNYKTKITLSDHGLNMFDLQIIAPDGAVKEKRLPLEEYLHIVAASNFKQRSRMAMLYYHAEARNYAVIGTANKNEHELGFFVKYGDSGADIKPILHLFKSQVYMLAEALNIPEEIRRRTPTTDTYSAEQTQQEFFFRLPFSVLDTIWAGWEAGNNAAQIAPLVDMSPNQVDTVIEDIKRKKRTTEYLRMPALTVNGS